MSVRHLLALDDLSDEEIRRILGRAAALDAPSEPATRGCLATLFSSSSLRTRVGFETAAHRLGWQSSHIADRRFDGQMSAAESLPDTFRTVSGMVDVIVARGPYDLRRIVEEATPTCPVICGGDRTEHPSQALIDAATIGRHSAQPLSSLRIGLLGDLTMRAARSLIGYLARFPPSEVRLLAAPGRRLPAECEPAGVPVTRGGPTDVEGLDVLYVVGLPAGSGPTALASEERRPFILDERQLTLLPSDAIVMSPLPVVDELSATVRRDHRLRIWEQNALGIPVRMAVLEAAAHQFGPET